MSSIPKDSHYFCFIFNKNDNMSVEEQEKRMKRLKTEQVSSSLLYDCYHDADDPMDSL